MLSPNNRLIIVACSLLALAVILGAMGAHLLENILAPKDMVIYQKANFYHFIHAIGILLLTGLGRRITENGLKVTYIFMLSGIVLFSGSLYLLSVSQVGFGSRWDFLGILAPIGGVSFIIGWLIPVFSIDKKYSRRHKKRETK